MKKGKKMATEWKKPIEKVKSPFSEKELLTMSFKEYWAQGFASARKEAEMKHQRKMDQDFKSDMYAQDTMKIELPEKYKHYPSHLADLEA
jgi:hypothetical protein